MVRALCRFDINLVQTMAPDWVVEALDLNIIPALTAMDNPVINGLFEAFSFWGQVCPHRLRANPFSQLQQTKNIEENVKSGFLLSRIWVNKLHNYSSLSVYLHKWGHDINLFENALSTSSALSPSLSPISSSLTHHPNYIKMIMFTFSLHKISLKRRQAECLGWFSQPLSSVGRLSSSWTSY